MEYLLTSDALDIFRRSPDGQCRDIYISGGCPGEFNVCSSGEALVRENGRMVVRPCVRLQERLRRSSVICATRLQQ